MTRNGNSSACMPACWPQFDLLFTLSCYLFLQMISYLIIYRLFSSSLAKLMLVQTSSKSSVISAQLSLVSLYCMSNHLTLTNHSTWKPPHPNCMADVNANIDRINKDKCRFLIIICVFIYCAQSKTSHPIKCNF